MIYLLKQKLLIKKIFGIRNFDLIKFSRWSFSNFDSAEISFGSNVNFAKSHSYLNKNNFNGVYSQQKEGLRITGALEVNLIRKQS